MRTSTVGAIGTIATTRQWKSSLFRRGARRKCHYVHLYARQSRLEQRRLKRSGQTPPSLPNYVNTCFANAAMQLLLVMPGVRDAERERTVLTKLQDRIVPQHVARKRRTPFSNVVFPVNLPEKHWYLLCVSSGKVKRHNDQKMHFPLADRVVEKFAKWYTDDVFQCTNTHCENPISDNDVYCSMNHRTCFECFEGARNAEKNRGDEHGKLKALVHKLSPKRLVSCLKCKQPFKAAATLKSRKRRRLEFQGSNSSEKKRLLTASEETGLGFQGGNSSEKGRPATGYKQRFDRAVCTQEQQSLLY